MRWRLVAIISIGINLLFGVAWLAYDPPMAASRYTRRTALAQTSNDVVQTKVVVRRQFFRWPELESPDYRTYIANLRDIGCPEQTIKDIIIADVNTMFARRRAAELVTPEQQWWRSEPDPELVAEAAEKARQLEDERRNLLSSLLGDTWEAGDMASLPRPSRPGVVLDGPVLGALPAETKQAVQDINARSQDRLEKYLAAQFAAGKNADPAELARLRQETRQELAQALPGPALEEYLLRYSQTANELRAEFGQLRYFNASPEEFRAVFRATDTLDQRILALTGNDPNTAMARRALENERENAIKLALGPARYEEYRNLQDPLYRQAVETAQQAGTPEAARTIYEVNLAAAAQQASITNNPGLTASQQALAQKQLELEQMTANALATGQQVLPESSGPPPIPRRTYTMHSGDNLAVVSTIYGVPISAIRQANPNVNFRRLRPGDVLVIPPSTLPPAAGP